MIDRLVNSWASSGLNMTSDDKPSTRGLTAALVGRSFVHPVFDYLLIGGGLSLILTAVVLNDPSRGAIFDFSVLPWFMLVSNSAHFASSTVRLYTKPGSQQAWPFLTFAFPLVVMVLLTGCLLLAGSVGPHLQSFYLTWSPYHYAAQAYGLAVMYAYRSGCVLAALDKRLLWWTSMLPFLYAFVGDQGSGLHWLLPRSVLEHRAFDAVHLFLINWLPAVSLAAAGLLFLKVAISPSGFMPVISILMLVANAAWWCFLPQAAFVWATIFHGIQYLAVVTIFHVKDQMSQPGNQRGLLYYVTSFYGLSLLLGYGLFSCLPWGFVMAGFGMVESIVLSVAAINIHHFIVDAYIWRLKSGDRNRKIVESGWVRAPGEGAVAV